MACKYCKYFDRVIEECLVVMEKMQENKNKQPPQNIQMMTTEPRNNETHINIVTRSGVVTGNDKTDGKKDVEVTWVRKTIEKSPVFDIQKEK